MSSDAAWFALGAMIFAGVAIFGVRTGRYRIKEFTRNPYMRRRESPIEFWTYTVLLFTAAIGLLCVAILVA